VLGVDPDPGAVERLKEAVREKGLEERFSALRHAGTLAPETLIVDPAPGSSWSWYL
jgi:hypothetical protein